MMKEEGIAFLIHISVIFRQFSLNDFEDLGLPLNRRGDVEIQIFNLYIPSIAAYLSGYNSSIKILLEGQDRVKTCIIK